MKFKKALALLLAFVMVFAFAATAFAAEPEIAAEPENEVTSATSEINTDLLVELRQGDYLGYELPNGTYAWRGIRYADAPLLQPPVPLPDKAEDAPVIEAFINGAGTSGMNSAKEDCLDLTVFLNPDWDVEKDGPRSVFMWIFGSANMGGALNARDGSAPAYDWSNFVKANPDIIVVTPTHRGGALGSIDLSVLPDYENYKDENGEPIYKYANNIARLDILEVLKWINANISAFGGDPNDVSIGGQSSGGNLCASVMMMPESKDLWQKALLQESFPLDASLMPLDEAKRVAENTFASYGIESIEQLITFLNDPATTRFGSVNPDNFGYKGQSPVIDDVVIRSNYFEQLIGEDGLWAGKSMIFGFNEGGYDSKYASYVEDGDGAINYHVNKVSMGNLGPYGWYAHPADIVDASGNTVHVENYAEYVIDQLKATSDEIGRDYYTAAKDLDEDLNIRLPAQLFAEAASDSADIYFYELTFNPSSVIGPNRAAHGSENSVIMMNWVAEDRGEDTAADRQIVGDRIAGIWGAFIRTGDPNNADLGGATWTPYKSETRDTMVLGNEFEMVNGVRNYDIDLLYPIMREYSKLIRIEGVPETCDSIDNIDLSNVTVAPAGIPARASSGIEWTVVDTGAETGTAIIRATIKDAVVDVKNGAADPYSLGVVTSDYTEEFQIKIVPAEEGGFVDVPADAYFADAVDWAVEEKITTGADETHFDPDGTCTRGQMVTFLWRAVGSPAAEADIAFVDVDENAYYYPAVKWAVSNGITNGVDETHFDPDGNILREQFATFIYRYVKLQGQGFTGSWMFPLNYEDAANVSDWANEAMHWCVMKGIINGVDDSHLDPQGDAGRAQVVTMLYRYFSASSEAEETYYDLSGKDENIDGMTFDGKVIITGENGRISFSSCTFNADIINNGGVGAIVVLFDDCTFADGVQCIIENEIEEATLETLFPKFMLFCDAPNVVCENVGAVVSLSDQTIRLNGTEYSISAAEYYINESTGEMAAYSGQDAVAHNICKWTENGKAVQMHFAVYSEE